MRHLILVLGDQLSMNSPALSDFDPAQDAVLMIEADSEATEVWSHKARIVMFLSAMRHFAEALRARGWPVDYLSIADQPSGSFAFRLEHPLQKHRPKALKLLEAGEFRMQHLVADVCEANQIACHWVDDTHFLCSRTEFAAWANSKRELRMEFFYREMRRETGLLMDGKDPAGGQWNFDKDNRAGLPRGVTPPPRLRTTPDAVTREAMADVERLFGDHFGTLEGFGWPTTAEEAEAALAAFLADILPSFGTWQDAMASGQPWMWHGLVSTSLNLGLLDPLEVCRRAEAEYRAGRAPLNAVEGFIRQILGWREFVRGIYWLKMPEYGARNALDADRSLPGFYWSGETDMACVADAVRTTRDHAYAHHIQRLMVTGNLAMLLGVHPDAVDDWYLAVYADAYEWVEMPNTRGMATFADGGIMGTKPYAASGAYINRMSNYCAGCRYDVKRKSGEGACPFNRLYWGFLERNRPRLGGNVRLAMPYRTLDGWDAARRQAMVDEAEACREALGAVRPG